MDLRAQYIRFLNTPSQEEIAAMNSDGFLYQCDKVELAPMLQFTLSADAIAWERTLVLQATVNGNAERLNKVLEASSDPQTLVNSSDLADCTPLHIAARFNRVEIAKILCLYGADCNIVSRSLSSPLNVACQFQWEEMIKFLLAHGADRLLRVPQDGTALHTIAMYATTRIADLVFEDDIKPPVNDVDDIVRYTPLHCAAQCGNAAMCTWLLEHGASLRAKDVRDSTPFMVASRQGHVDVMKALFFSYGADVKERQGMLHDADDEGMVALHLAVLENRYQAAEELLQWGADPDTLNAHNLSPLHLCAVNGTAQMLPLLMGYKADPSLKDRSGKTPLHKAVTHQKVEVVAALIKEGADTDAQDINFMTPLHLACTKGYTDIVKLLVAHGADLNIKNFYNQTCLHVAVEEGHLDIMEILLEQCVDNDALISATDMFNQSIMHIAARSKDHQFIDALLRRGFSAFGRDIAGRLPLHVAARSSSYETVHRLANVTPNVNAECFSGKSAFFMACETGNEEAMHALISKGANVKDTDICFRNALMAAAIGGFTDIVIELIKMGLQVNSTDKERNTALHHACANAQLSTVKALLSHNASVIHTNVYGMTPLEVAVTRSKEEIAVFLMEHSSWEDSLSVRNKDGHTSLYSMILYTPAAAKIALDKCVRKSHHAPTDEGYAIEFTYTHIDPMEEKSSSNHNISSLLIAMLDYEREELLSHPLCQSLLSYKWHGYGKFVFALSTAFHFGLSLLMCLFYFWMYKPHEKDYMCKKSPDVSDNSTDFAMTTTLRMDPFNYSFVSPEVSTRPPFRYGYMYGLQFSLYVFGGIMLLCEFLSLLIIGKVYAWSYEFVLQVISLVFLFIANLPPGYEPCDNEWRLLSYAMLIYLFLASLTLRRIDQIGLYLTMFFEVTRTFIKISAVLAFFILASSMPLSVMINEDGFMAHQPAFLTTLAMTLGELNYIDNFVRADNAPFSIDLYILFPIFCLTMNLCLMNLMIGVAVGDISKVEKKAYFTRMRTQVKFLMEMERSTFLILRNKFYTGKLIIRPNSKPKNFSDRVKRKVLCREQINFIQNEQKSDLNAEAVQDFQEELETQKERLNRLVKTTDEILEVLYKLSSTQTMHTVT